MTLLPAFLRFVLPCLILPIVFTSKELQADVPLGTTLILTGNGSSWGTEALNGMTLAVDEINASGGVHGERLRLHVEDFGSLDLKRAASAAQKLLSIPNVRAILPFVTEDTEVVWPLAKRRGVLTFAIAAGADDLLRERELLFRAAPSDGALLDAAVTEGRRTGGEKACFLASPTAYYEPMAEKARARWEASGGTVGVFERITSGSMVDSSLLAKLRRVGCDTLFFFTVMETQGVLLRRMHEANWVARRIGLQTCDDPAIHAMAGPGIEGFTCVRFSLSTPSFAEVYRARFGESPRTPAAAFGHDAIVILTRAMRTGGLNAEAMATEIRRTTNLQGASGLISYGPGGERVPSGIEILSLIHRPE